MSAPTITFVGLKQGSKLDMYDELSWLVNERKGRSLTKKDPIHAYIEKMATKKYSVIQKQPIW